MKAISQGNNFTIYNNTLKTYDQLPAQVYNVCFSPRSGFSLESTADLEINEDKIYGIHNVKVAKVLNSFRLFNRNLGVILSGDKGIGKSLFAKLLSVEAIKLGYPMIIVNTYVPGIASYIESIEQECIVMFDEFDKTFGDVKAEDGNASPQTELLTLFDGLAHGKKLFVITCNELNKLNDYLVNRPGRFHYHFRFEYPSAEEVGEYLRDKLPEAYYDQITDVVAFSRKIKLNYDCLRSIAFEINTGISFKDAIKDLNIINVNDESYSIQLRFDNGVSAGNICRLDLFGSGDDESFWLDDKRGYTFVNVSFNTADCVFDDKLLTHIIPPDKLNLRWSCYDEDEPEVKALVESEKASKCLGLIIKRNYDKNIHYCV